MTKMPQGTGIHATAIRDHERRLNEAKIDDLPSGIVDRTPRGTVVDSRAKRSTVQPVTTFVPRWG